MRVRDHRSSAAALSAANDGRRARRGPVLFVADQERAAMAREGLVSMKKAWRRPALENSLARLSDDESDVAIAAVRHGKLEEAERIIASSPAVPAPQRAFAFTRSALPRRQR
jgi:hypothetical protein